jgi:hypothetical protein
MSELLAIPKEKEEKIRELEALAEKLERCTVKTRELEREVEQLLLKSGLVKQDSIDSLIFELIGVDDESRLSYRLHTLAFRRGPISILTVLRTLERKAEEIEGLTDLAKNLRIPDPPPMKFSRQLEGEAEILRESLHLERVKLKEMNLYIYSRRGPALTVQYEGRTGVEEKTVDEVWTLFLQLLEEAKGLMEEAIKRFEEYSLRLVELRDRILQSHQREILMHDL